MYTRSEGPRSYVDPRFAEKALHHVCQDDTAYRPMPGAPLQSVRSFWAATLSHSTIGVHTCAGLFFEAAFPLASAPRDDWSRFATTAVQPV